MKLRDQAYQRFTRGLLAREIRAGQFVSQRELTELTGMPLGAIRELIPRLEADGLIRGEWEHPERRSRRFYRLTEAGRDALARWSEEWRATRAGVDSVLDNGATGGDG